MFTKSVAESDHVLEQASLLGFGIKFGIRFDLRIIGSEVRGQVKYIIQHKVRKLHAILRLLVQSLADHLGERSIRSVAFGAGFPHKRAPTGNLRLSDNLAHQPRLTNSRLAADEKRLTSPIGYLTPQAPRLFVLAFAPHDAATHDAIEDSQLFALAQRGVCVFRRLEDFKHRGGAFQSI